VASLHELKILAALWLTLILIGCVLTLYDWIEHKENRDLPPLGGLLIFIGVGGLAITIFSPLVFIGLAYLLAPLLLPFGLHIEGWNVSLGH
jgi:hypothetical protein